VIHATAYDSGGNIHSVAGNDTSNGCEILEASCVFPRNKGVLRHGAEFLHFLKKGVAGICE
jgi:hypothetical protein